MNRLSRICAKIVYLGSALIALAFGSQCHSADHIDTAQPVSPFNLSASTPGDSHSSGEFDGDYKIGNMICTVRPIKMAFEIKCANQPGAAIFFANTLGELEPKNATFVSQEKAGKRSSITFNCEDYNDGVFVAPDGSRFSIQRIQKAVPQSASSTH